MVSGSLGEPPVRLTQENAVAIIELAHPPMNPLDTAMRDALIAAIRAVADDPDVRACVVHGGTENFAAGADIKALAEMGYEEIVGWNERLNVAFTALARLPLPVIAAINGYALGGGLELALAADFRIGSNTCKVGLPEVTLGIVPGSGGTQRLPQIVGRSTAKLLMMTGRHIAADEALHLGILDEIVEPARTLPRAYELADTLAAAPRHAVRAIKECVDAAVPISEAGLALERSALAGMFATGDRDTAMARFLNRRKRT
ncbi:enoyl-CoA hydratase/isomerase family protein [Mycobacterium sp. SMC-2]|uniref:enoyl-CoA hydratase/isomerase family protein n=1 Tax=Mycobacterium sp. SMC-2 TaxID=2857058 RepID=UPI0021B1BE81|nr:enoyl-CoA hydratase/isomerase family protein [Mycobacterium sp. SMC-2]